MALYRVKMRWTGFNGAPGYTVLHFDAQTTPTAEGAQQRADAVHAFFNAVSSACPSVVRFTLETGVEVIEETTGELQTVFTVTSLGGLSGTQTGGFSSATGACITWNTGGVRNGRRVKGRTFIVPLASTQYENDGTLTAAALTDLQAAADQIVAAGWDLQVFGRPTTPDGTDGESFTVTSARINDKTAILRSRRD